LKTGTDRKAYSRTYFITKFSHIKDVACHSADNNSSQLKVRLVIKLPAEYLIIFYTYAF